MVTQFGRGQKSQLSAITQGTDLYIGIQVNAPGTSWDISCFGLDANDRLSDDRFFIFFNQPKSPEGSIQQLGAQSGDTESFRLTLDAVPPSIHKLSFCAALDGAGSASQITSGYFRIVVGGQEVMRYPFTGADFTSERAVMIGDVYRKGVWRVTANGQGFAGGLAELIRSFGGEVEDPAPAPPPAPAAGGFAPPPPPAGGFAPPPAPAGGFAPPPGAPAARPPAPATPQAPGYGQPPAAAAAAGAASPLVNLYKEPPPSQAQPVPPGAMASLTPYAENQAQGRWVAQNSKLVKVRLGEDALALRGSMVAYQGNIDFDYKSRGLRGMLEEKLTGQGLKLMTCKGQGEVFLAQDASDLHIVELGPGQKLCVNTKNVLAFDATITNEVKRIESAGIPGGGIFHFEMSGPGTIVVMTKGTPMTLPVQGPTFADINALVAWTVGMRVSVSSQVRISRQVYHTASGESHNLQFQGMGGGHFVVVQPYEV
ncbi:TerD family protein [Pseudofrankia asymbiotica]|uniref:TerD domain-containing protein n=1 Tax=Pseudofrankia asymbiotica TaxID=1834516 RepID=A0A1V2IB89_9ACTN|nr:TerD family protein [Pseudofrankia asymbiotica]ONH30472.1 hypothetical protein BL253_13325 [Pseudofrankia asymbiotica]